MKSGDKGTHYPEGTEIPGKGKLRRIMVSFQLASGLVWLATTKTPSLFEREEEKAPEVK